MTCLLSLTGITADGCKILFISRKLFFMTIKIRDILIPPLTDPFETPVKINTMPDNNKK